MALQNKKSRQYPTPSQCNFMKSEYKKYGSDTTQSQCNSKDKKGGPYTSKEQETRRKQVYELHFEKGFPAIKIAEMLNINRNTVNADIKELYGMVSKELPDYNASLLLKQIHRLESQYARLQDELEKNTDTKNKFLIEKLLFSINSKITSEVSKIVLNRVDRFARLRNSE